MENEAAAAAAAAAAVEGMGGFGGFVVDPIAGGIPVLFPSKGLGEFPSCLLRGASRFRTGPGYGGLSEPRSGE